MRLYLLKWERLQFFFLYLGKDPPADLTTNEKGFGEEHSTYEYIVEGELNLNDGNLVKRFPNFGLEWEIHFTMSIDNELPDGVTPSMSITGDFKLCSLILIIVNNLNKKDRYWDKLPRVEQCYVAAAAAANK